MSDETNDNGLLGGVKRRDFLKLVGVTTAAAASAGCLEFPPQPPW